MLKPMVKHAAVILSTFLLAACATYGYPLRDAGDGVYFAASPPERVYVDYPAFAWGGPPYLYPAAGFGFSYAYSPWYGPGFGMHGFSDHRWHAPYRWPEQRRAHPYDKVRAADAGRGFPGYAKVARGNSSAAGRYTRSEVRAAPARRSTAAHQRTDRSSARPSARAEVRRID